MSSSAIRKLITIDGPAASGKSSLSALLAKKLNWKWLSTGVFYRGLAFLAISKQKIEEDSILEIVHRQEWKVHLSQEHTQFIYQKKDITDRIYTSQVDVVASQLAGKPAIRRALLESQRSIFTENTKGLIAEGRDCGTVIFPEAPLKIYLTAGDSIRAERRADQRGLSPDRIIEAQKKEMNRIFLDLSAPCASRKELW